MLIYFIRRRPDLPAPCIFWLVGACILGCGTTHLMEVITTYHPIYWASGLVKAFTAAVSLATVVALVPLTPRVLALPGPEELQREIALRRKAEEELEQRVHERTAELAALNEALLRSNKDLEEFAYVASHDLQEPLRKIQSFGERLTTRCRVGLDDLGRDCVQRMNSAAARMQRLINDLLMFSRVTTSAHPPALVDLNKVAAEALSDLEERVQECGGQVHIGPLPTVRADATQMRQLFQNLIGNALKFHRPDVAPEVHVLGRDVHTPKEGQHPCHEIVVRDNGIGFEPIYAERIFQVFQRLHGRGQYEGTGVGLAICRKIVESHGGSILADSVPGQGATFTIQLPVEAPVGKPGPAFTRKVRHEQADHDTDGRRRP